MEFHQRDNSLHPGRRSSGWKALLVGTPCARRLPRSQPRSARQCPARAGVSSRDTAVIHACRVPLHTVSVPLAQWFSARPLGSWGRRAVSARSLIVLTGICHYQGAPGLLQSTPQCTGLPPTKGHPRQASSSKSRNPALA